MREKGNAPDKKINIRSYFKIQSTLHCNEPKRKKQNSNRDIPCQNVCIIVGFVIAVIYI